MYEPCMTHEQFLQSQCEVEHLAVSDKTDFFANQLRSKGSFFLCTNKF